MPQSLELSLSNMSMIKRARRLKGAQQACENMYLHTHTHTHTMEVVPWMIKI